MLKQKCPVCLRGTTFRGSITMNDNCPECGLRFEREQGYFLAALYIAYGLAVPVLSILTFICWLLDFGSVGRSFAIAILLFFPLSPLVFRYSRVVWMHIDQAIDPRPESPSL
jgi:uncharacterized protein (DUF983 family)